MCDKKIAHIFSYKKKHIDIRQIMYVYIDHRIISFSIFFSFYFLNANKFLPYKNTASLIIKNNVLLIYQYGLLIKNTVTFIKHLFVHIQSCIIPSSMAELSANYINQIKAQHQRLYNSHNNNFWVRKVVGLKFMNSYNNPYHDFETVSLNYLIDSNEFNPKFSVLKPVF